MGLRGAGRGRYHVSKENVIEVVMFIYVCISMLQHLLFEPLGRALLDPPGLLEKPGKKHFSF